MDTSATIQYKIDVVKKNSGESEVDAIRRVVQEHAKQGWKVVEAAGDENLVPSLIFEKCADAVSLEIRVEALPKPAQGDTDLHEVHQKLNDMNQEGWLTLTVLDSIFTHPIAIMQKTDSKPADAELLIKSVSAGVFDSIPKAILEEVRTEATGNNRTLRTVMNSGLHPILIFGDNKGGAAFDYEVEYAQGGLFSNRSKELSKLIDHRAQKGWQVCGAFEDSFRMPCVVFRKSADKTDA